MKNFFIALPTFALLICPHAAAQVTSNVFERVLEVRVNAGTLEDTTATAFTLDVDGREYLITAGHVVGGLGEENTINIRMNNGWAPINVRIFRCASPIDIAVLVPPHQLTVNSDLPFASTFFGGQVMYFLGFPFGIETPMGLNGPYPLAIVKRGIFSGFRSQDENPKDNQMLLDGYSNPGFSGGPIVYWDRNQVGTKMILAAVVSGFIPEVVPAMTKRDIKSPADADPIAKAQPWRIGRRPNGTYFEYLDNGTYVPLNTGIVVGYYIQSAVDLIHQHPIGPVAKDLPNNQPQQLLRRVVILAVSVVQRIVRVKATADSSHHPADTGWVRNDMVEGGAAGMNAATGFGMTT